MSALFHRASHIPLAVLLALVLFLLPGPGARAQEAGGALPKTPAAPEKTGEQETEPGAAGEAAAAADEELLFEGWGLVGLQGAKVGTIYEGTSNMQKQTIAKVLMR